MENRKFANVLSGFALSAMMILSGCASSGGGMAGPDPRLTNGDSAKFFSKSGYQACAMGAAAGMVGCALSNSGNKATCAVAAGLLACGVAMGANYYYDDRRSKYSNTTQRLDAMTADVKADSEKVAMRTELMKSVINEDKQAISELNNSIAQKKVDKKSAEQKLVRIDSNIKSMRNEIANMEKKSAEYRSAAKLERDSGVSAQEIAATEAEISKLEQQVARLNVEVNELYSQRSAVTLG